MFGQVGHPGKVADEPNGRDHLPQVAGDGRLHSEQPHCLVLTVITREVDLVADVDRLLGQLEIGVQQGIRGSGDSHTVTQTHHSQPPGKLL
nr:hypothetical protein [Nocardia albiluteola]